jgi:hypothetical protein
MNEKSHQFAAAQQDLFGRAVAARLAASTADLPHELSERLRAARMQALARRKPAPQPVRTVRVSAGQASLTPGDEGPSLWHRVAAVLPLLALVAGLIAIEVVQKDRRASEVAEVDAALLTDDLPPSAYADPGFAQFLKSGR